jgi:alpha-galactosidase
MRLSVVMGVVLVTAAPASAEQTWPVAPPMGWNSWNSGIALTEQSIEATIDAMVASGMRDAGYRYVNLDAGWAAPQRDSRGDIQADPHRFPHGIAALARYAHARGMYLGLYSSPYNQTCGQVPGNAGAGHEVADADTFAGWGVDYLKYDWCSLHGDHAAQLRVFGAMRDALRHSGRRIFYSINPNSSADPTAGARYDWSGIADMSRNSSDLIPLWHNTLPNAALRPGFTARSVLGVIDQFAAALPPARRSRPGYFNDPDMLVTGVQLTGFFGGHLGLFPGLLCNGCTHEQLAAISEALTLPSSALAVLNSPQFSLTPDEQRTHFSLWAMLAAPLLAGNDITTMSAQTRDILTNREVVAVDQDPLVSPGVALPNDNRVIVKPLSDGSVAVALINWGDVPAAISTTAAAVGLRPAACYRVRDLWAHSDSFSSGTLTGLDIPAHGILMLRVTVCY